MILKVVKVGERFAIEGGSVHVERLIGGAGDVSLTLRDEGGARVCRCRSGQPFVVGKSLLVMVRGARVCRRMMFAIGETDESLAEIIHAANRSPVLKRWDAAKKRLPRLSMPSPSRMELAVA